MKTFQIKTAQNVNITFTIANAGQRLFAFIIDNIIKFTYLYFAYLFFDFQSIGRIFSNDAWTVKALEILIFLPITFYSLYSEILMKGQTLGKKLVKIKVINIEGFKPTITDFVMRWFLRIVDFNFFILILIYVYSVGLQKEYMLILLIFVFGKIVGLLLIIFTYKNQRFGDIIANTVVIYLKDDVLFSDTILENLTTLYVPMYPNVIKLSDNDVRIIKETFKSAHKYKDFKTQIKLRAKIEEVTGIVPKQNSDAEFIDTVLKDYNFYTQRM
ncbi:MAG: RDD family protein, partial [Polaribacter sp.]